MSSHQYQFHSERSPKTIEDDDYLDSFPPGYRFCPTDSELVMDYLYKKVMNWPLPRNKIAEVNLYADNPETFAAQYEKWGDKEWYFFTPRVKKYRNGTRPSRSAGDGYWKATGADKAVLYQNQTVGYKKSLVFHLGHSPRGTKTNWIMHEFRVVGAPRSNSSANDMRLDDWVLSRIYEKAEQPTCAPAPARCVPPAPTVVPYPTAPPVAPVNYPPGSLIVRPTAPVNYTPYAKAFGNYKSIENEAFWNNGAENVGFLNYGARTDGVENASFLNDGAENVNFLNDEAENVSTLNDAAFCSDEDFWNIGDFGDNTAEYAAFWSDKDFWNTGDYGDGVAFSIPDLGALRKSTPPPDLGTDSPPPPPDPGAFRPELLKQLQQSKISKQLRNSQLDTGVNCKKRKEAELQANPDSRVWAGSSEA